MARTQQQAQLVPLADCGWLPYFRTNAARTDWLNAHGVQTFHDWNDRECVTVDTAYAMNERMKAEAQQAAAERQAAAAKLADAIAEAQQRRQATWTRHYLDEVAKRGGSTIALADARREAWILTRISERRLPAEVRDQLGAVTTDGLPGSAGFHMAGNTYLNADDLARINGAPVTAHDSEGF